MAAVDVFGHASIDRSNLTDEEAAELAKEHTLFVEKGILSWVFSHDTGTKIDWSQTYTKKDLKKMAKEMKSRK